MSEGISHEEHTFTEMDSRRFNYVFFIKKTKYVTEEEFKAFISSYPRELKENTIYPSPSSEMSFTFYRDPEILEPGLSSAPYTIAISSSRDGITPSEFIILENHEELYTAYQGYLEYYEEKMKSLETAEEPGKERGKEGEEGE